MTTVTCIETSIDHEKNYSASFVIEPLDAGHGITVGNAIRRTLLSDLTGFAITGVRMNNVKHEFETVPGLREDVLEVILNLKEIAFKASFLARSKGGVKWKGFLNVKGPMIVTAGMFRLPKHILKIINPHQYICTLVNSNEFYLEIEIEQGTGYKLTEELRKKQPLQTIFSGRPSLLAMDANFSPIQKVNYKIKLIHDTQGHIKESLFLEIQTDGSLTPKRSLLESIKILLTLFSTLLLSPQFLTFSSRFRKRKKRILQENLPT